MTFPEPGFVVNGTLGLLEIKALSSMKIHKNNFLELFANSPVADFGMGKKIEMYTC